MHEVTESSIVPASPADVWDRVASLEGINYELRPWMRMTAPRGFDTLDPAEIRLGERLFRSWILLFGVIPFDYDDLTVVRLEPGKGFLERSEMLSQRVWEHERTLEPDGAGTRVTDRLRFEPRARAIGGISRALVARTFRHRHKRLRSWFAA